MLILVAIQNLLSILVILGIFFWKSKTPSEAITSIAAAWLLMVGIVLSGTWLYPPPIGKWLYVAALAGASIKHFLILNRQRPKLVARLKQLATALSVGLGGLLLWQGISGRMPTKGEFIDLAAPLDEAAGHCVVSGGSSIVHNFHYRLGSNAASRYEMHAVDFIKQSAFGIRVKSTHALIPQPKDPAAYLIFDENVLAPCSGEVTELEENKPDHPAGNKNRRTDGANYVTVKCGDTLVTLAHLRRGSILVKTGQSVRSGTLMGKIGNSGNTEEPHLHVHAQTLPDAQGLSDPIPLRFKGRFLSKGECL